MKFRLALPPMSLRAKLVFSYLGVALGAVLILTIAITLTVQNYFDRTQKDQLHRNAHYLAREIGQSYRANQGNWAAVPLQTIQTNGPVLLEIMDTNEQPLLDTGPSYLTINESAESLLDQALKQALQGQEVDGRLLGSADSREFSGLYVSLPLHYNGQDNGQIIGALLIAFPEQQPSGFYPVDFLSQVNLAILSAGLAVAIIVILFSLLLARSLTRPLALLTRAAERMKSGNYAERVEPPHSRDELARLSVTFNAMAERIETDVTELRRQEQLRRDLIANIAHDLATPLTAIQGFSEALADEVITEPEARHETAQLIGREVQRLRRLVGDMQQMTALESGRIQLELAPLDISALVNETLAVIQPECEQAGISMKNEITPLIPPVLADSDRLTQVLLNLLDNARRHTPSGGTITVGTKAEGKMLTLFVCDTGVGIESSDLPHIFERFYRVDRSRTGTTGGSGLGLSIVKAIISAHGGTIQAQSTPGHGTCILFTLPLTRSI